MDKIARVRNYLNLKIKISSHWGYVRKGFVAIAGTASLFVGTCMLVLPGPGLLVIAGGISLLALEFKWAQDLLGRIKEAVKQIKPLAWSKNLIRRIRCSFARWWPA